MSELSSNIFLYLGKLVKDEYGRQIGKIASFAVNEQINEVFLEGSDGEFARYVTDQFRIDGNDIILSLTLNATRLVCTKKQSSLANTHSYLLESVERSFSQLLRTFKVISSTFKQNN
jgi:hypothetical protein